MEKSDGAEARNKRDGEKMSISSVASYFVAHGGDLAKWFGFLSSGIGILFYVIHSVRIHYVPSTEFTELAGVFVLLFIVGSVLLGYFALLVVVPAALWASTIRTERLASGKEGVEARKPDCRDYFVALIFIGTPLMFSLIVLCPSLDFLGSYASKIGTAIVGIAAVAGSIQCDNRSGRTREGLLLRAFMRLMVVFILLLALAFTALIATAPGLVSQMKLTCQDGKLLGDPKNKRRSGTGGCGPRKGEGKKMKASRAMDGYTIEEHRHRFAAWAAGWAASVKGCRFTVEIGRRLLERAGFEAPTCYPDSLPNNTDRPLD